MLFTAGGREPFRQLYGDRRWHLRGASGPRVPLALPPEPLRRARHPAAESAALGFVRRGRFGRGCVHRRGAREVVVVVHVLVVVHIYGRPVGRFMYVIITRHGEIFAQALQIKFTNGCFNVPPEIFSCLWRRRGSD